MDRFIFTIDRFSEWTGKAFAWCIVAMTLGVAYEIVVRKVFNAPTAWAFDLSYIMYGTLFMMAGAYTLSRNGHVRGDVFYRLLSPKKQATIELSLYIILFFPGVIAMTAVGFSYSAESWFYNNGAGEVSINSPAGVPIANFKTILPIAALIIMIQGLAEVLRCVVCLRTGEWPKRLSDVEELEQTLLDEKKKADAAAS